MEMDDDLALLGIAGRLLMQVRELVGWSRATLSNKMLRSSNEEGAPCSAASILRYEKRAVVPLNFARCYREAIGAARFDKLLEVVRERSAAASRRATGHNNDTRRKR